MVTRGCAASSSLETIRERSLTIGGWGGGGGDGRAGKFWGRAAIFWAPIYGGLTFSGPHLGEGYNFWAPLGDVSVLLNGFCATEILSTA